MTANRSAPTIVTDPGGMAGDAYTTRIAEEIAALYKGRFNHVSSIGGTANAITGVCTPPLTAAYQTGETFRFTPTANNTSTVTVNFDSRGAVALRDPDAAALAADDLVNGRSVDCWYDGSVMRLGHPTMRALLAALTAAIADASSWEVLGDTTVGAPVANVEHVFTADGYVQIRTIVSGGSFSAGSNSLRIGLRTSGAEILANAIGGGAIAAANIIAADGVFTLDLVSATRSYYGYLRGTRDATVMTVGEGGATSASIVDRVRYAAGVSGNLDAGRIITLGLKKPS